MEYRTSKLVMTELLDYCWSKGMSHPQIDLDLSTSQSVITISGQVPERPSDLEEVIDKLDAPRQPEFEDYYIDLLGLQDDQFHTDIIAALINEVEAEFVSEDGSTDGQLSMTVRRYH